MSEIKAKIITLKEFIYAHTRNPFVWHLAMPFLDYAMEKTAIGDWFALDHDLDHKDLPFVVPLGEFDEIQIRFNRNLPKAIGRCIGSGEIQSLTGWTAKVATQGRCNTIFQRL